MNLATMDHVIIKKNVSQIKKMKHLFSPLTGFSIATVIGYCNIYSHVPLRTEHVVSGSKSMLLFAQMLNVWKI